MDREFVTDYLGRSGMEPAQAQALSHILGQTATQHDLKLLRQQLRAMEQRFDGRLHALEQNVALRFDAMDEKLESGLHAMDEKLEGSRHAMDEKLESSRHTLEEKLENRLHEMDERWEARFSTFGHQMDVGINGVRQEMLEMETRMMWRFVALLGAFAALTTALDVLIG